MGEMLDKLHAEQPNLLLGEVAALLHNLGKLSDAFISYQLISQPAYNAFQVAAPNESFINITDQAKSELANSDKERVWKYLSPAQKSSLCLPQMGFVLFPQDHFHLIEILSLWHVSRLRRRGTFKPGNNASNNWLNRSGYLLWLLDQCHGTAHVDKTEPGSENDEEAIATQLEDAKPKEARISSVFGIDRVRVGEGNFSLTDQLVALDFSSLTDRSEDALVARRSLQKILESPFSQGIADTQHPINEVTLWDWSWSVAALYKSALAQLVIEMKSIGATKRIDLQWRTLRVTIDVLGLLTKAHRIPDLLGYDRAINRLFRQIKHIIEEKYPLGNEIYRDSTGIYFTFPDLVDNRPYEELCTEIMALPIIRHYPELSPVVDIGMSWGELIGPLPKWLEAPRMLAEQHIASRGDIITGSMQSQVDWQKTPQWQQDDEVCPVCGIRGFQKKGRNPKDKEDEYRRQRCKVCEDRATNVLRSWQRGVICETPWLDEIGDKHDRIALIVGRFQLDSWLDGSLIETLYAGKDKQGVQQFKEPSPARIMRVWRTTEEFWTKSVAKILARIPDAERQVVQIQWNENNTPTDNEVVLDGTVNGAPISLFRHQKNWLTIINPKIMAVTLKQEDEVQVRQDNGPWRKGKILGQPTTPDTLANYQPTRTLLTTPDQFLVLVPGSDALDIAQQIAAQYACEMGKVRSRLPLDLALVYFHRKMPLYAAIDAARRFLDAKPRAEETWSVKKATPDAATQVTKIEFAQGVDWEISTGFGDGITEDHFYPYVALADEKKLKGDRHYYVDKGKPEQRLYTHVGDLADDATILVAPSHFSYLWLDNSTRRYSIGPEDKDVPFPTQRVPLEEIEPLTEMWAKFKSEKITDTKLHGVIQLLLEKRMAWKDDATFVPFALDVLRHNKLYCLLFGKEAPSEAASLAAIERLFRCFDLHHRIMKAKLAE